MSDAVPIAGKRAFAGRLIMSWRWLAAGSAILALLVAGGLSALRAARSFSLEGCIFTLAVTLCPAVAYAFAYFRVFPEVLSTESGAQKELLLSRWSTFARIATGVAILMAWLCWALIAAENHILVIRLDKSPSIVTLFVLGMLTTRPIQCIFGAILAAALMTLCVVTTETYLVRTMGKMPEHLAKGWLSIGMKGLGACGGWLARLLTPRCALILGGMLLLFSLIAQVDLFGGYGFEVVTGQQNWPTAEYTLVGPVRAILNQAGRWIYIAALVIAVLALVAAAMGRLGNRLRASVALAFASMAIAIFALCDLTLGVARLDSAIPQLLNFSVLAIVWVLPIAVWRLRAHGEATRWNQTRIVIMVLYLPVVLAGLALLPLALILVPSYAFFLLGSGFLALGFLQSTQESAVGTAVVEEEPQMCQVIELQVRNNSGSANREVPVAPVSRMAVVHVFRPAHPRNVKRVSSSGVSHSGMYNRDARSMQDLALRRSVLNRLRDEYLASDKAGRPCSLDAAKDERGKAKQQIRLLDREEGKRRAAAPNRLLLMLRKLIPDSKVASSTRTPGSEMSRLALVTTGNSAASPEAVR